MPRRQRISRPKLILQLLLVIIFTVLVSTWSLLRHGDNTPSVGLPLSLETYLDGRQRDYDTGGVRRHSTGTSDKKSRGTQNAPQQDAAIVSSKTRKELPNDDREPHRREAYNGVIQDVRTGRLPAANLTTTINRDVLKERKEAWTQNTATFFTKMDESTGHIYSDYFFNEVPLSSLMERGNVLTVHTGCSIATWSYQGMRHTYRPLNDCRQHAKNSEAFRAHVLPPGESAHHLVQKDDSIYVPIVKLEHFVNETLPHIQNKFVLLSGQNSLPPNPIPRRVYDAIIEHPLILKWFLQNLPIHAYNPHDPKLVPFPYGVHPMQPAALLAEMKKNVTKNNFMFKSWFQKSNNSNARRDVPNGEKVDTGEYLRRMHQSEYVLSPDGDRPECHRHYEAIALGTVPITSLDPHLYRHLQANVVFDEHQWNLTDLEVRLPRRPEVNQRLIFEEYWMEYVEREVGRPMRWWDPSREVRCLLEEIRNVVRNMTTTEQQRANDELPHDVNDRLNVERYTQENVAQLSSQPENITTDQRPDDALLTNNTDGVNVERISQEIVAPRLDGKSENITTIEKGPNNQGLTDNSDGRGEGRPESQERISLVSDSSSLVKGAHYPSFFSDNVPLEKLIARKNLLTVYTGCSICTWSFDGMIDRQNKLSDCIRYKGLHPFLMHHLANDSVSQIQKYDSIYVPIAGLAQFIKDILPYIETDVILVSGQRANVPSIPKKMYDTLIEHPRIVRWFLQNLSVYAYDPRHPKISPFPYGLLPKDEDVYLAEMQRKGTKDKLIFVGFILRKNNMESRKEVPRSEMKLPPLEYFHSMHESQYVLSPNGDRPECHRHYEAIGMGTMPITTLDPHLYRHLQGNAVFDEHGWNLTELQGRLPRNPLINRRLLFEEYWMEYMEREVGQTMRWWDPSRNVRCSLEEISELVRAAPKGESTTDLRIYNDSKSTSNSQDETEPRESVALVSRINESVIGAHYPSYFSDEVPLEKLIERGNLLTVFAGCSIATFSFNGELNQTNVHNDCQRYNGVAAYKKHRVTNDTISQLQPYDSIYVTIEALGLFVDSILPHIETDFILLTGQNSIVPQIPKELYETLIEHPRIVRWFLQNQSVYAYDARNPKLGVFPYGMFTRNEYKFLREMSKNVSKDSFIFAGFVRKKNNLEARKDVPVPRKKLREPEYWQLLHKSQYVLSPDGDRPECHRHYEAIGMGTMPITSLDPDLHRHLKGNVVFGEKRWNLTVLELRLPRNPVVNRRLVFQEYWMEFIEREVGRPMRWWDPSRFGVRCYLDEIANIVKNSS